MGNRHRPVFVPYHLLAHYYDNNTIFNYSDVILFYFYRLTITKTIRADDSKQRARVYLQRLYLVPIPEWLSAIARFAGRHTCTHSAHTEEAAAVAATTGTSLGARFLGDFRFSRCGGNAVGAGGSCRTGVRRGSKGRIWCCGAYAVRVVSSRSWASAGFRLVVVGYVYNILRRSRSSVDTRPRLAYTVRIS